jgi:hypothetical protein
VKNNSQKIHNIKKNLRKTILRVENRIRVENRNSRCHLSVKLYMRDFEQISSYLLSKKSKSSKSYFRSDLFAALTICFYHITGNSIFQLALYQPTFQEVFKKLSDIDAWIFNKKINNSHELLLAFYEGVIKFKGFDAVPYMDYSYCSRFHAQENRGLLSFCDLLHLKKEYLIDYLLGKEDLDSFDAKYLCSVIDPSGSMSTKQVLKEIKHAGSTKTLTHMESVRLYLVHEEIQKNVPDTDLPF